MKHSPLPWRVSEYNAQCVIDANGETVCMVEAGSDGDAKANAKLIVAVSELLEACKMQHAAIDTLFARLISADIGFYPTQSKEWAACVRGMKAIKLATEQIRIRTSQAKLFHLERR